MLEQSAIVQKAININLGLNSKQVNSPNQANLNFEKFKGLVEKPRTKFFL